MKGMGVILLLFVFGTFTSNSAQYYHKVNRTGGYARILSMGSNRFIKDPYFIIYNPAWASKYDNFILGDIGSTLANNFEKGGVGEFISANIRANRNFVFGAILTRKDFMGGSIAKLDQFNLVGETNSTIGGASVTPLDNNMELFGSYNINGHTFGLGIAYASSKKENKPATGGSSIGSASQLGINIGYLSSFTKNIILDISGYIIFPSTSFENPKSSQTEFNQTIIGINARGFIYTSSSFAIVPVVSFIRSSGTADIGDANGVTTTDLPSFTTLNIGFGVNYQIGNFLLAGGPSFDLISATQPAVSGISPELITKTTSFPHWNVGAEWTLVEWLIARIGYDVSTNKQSTESTASPTTKNELITTTYSPNNGGLSLGVGFRFGGFSLDASVNEDVIRQGLNNVGGGGATFSYLTASFAF